MEEEKHDEEKREDLPAGIVCKNLKKIANGKTILHDLSLVAEHGKITALLGPNGAGKTTGFALLCGLERPSAGRIYLDSREITDYPMYKRARLGIGYLPQESSIFRGLTVEENILSVLEMTHIKKSRQHLDKLLEDLNLKHVRKTPAISVSGGERRKLEIARALATDPKFILLDEPLAGIDPIAIGEMHEMIVSLKERGIGIVITDHNVRDTLPIVDYAYVLFNGKILTEGTAKQITAHPEAKKVYFGVN